MALGETVVHLRTFLQETQRVGTSSDPSFYLLILYLYFDMCVDVK